MDVPCDSRARAFRLSRVVDPFAFKGDLGRVVTDNEVIVGQPEDRNRLEAILLVDVMYER